MKKIVKFFVLSLIVITINVMSVYAQVAKNDPTERESIPCKFINKRSTPVWIGNHKGGREDNSAFQSWGNKMIRPGEEIFFSIVPDFIINPNTDPTDITGTNTDTAATISFRVSTDSDGQNGIDAMVDFFDLDLTEGFAKIFVVSDQKAKDALTDKGQYDGVVILPEYSKDNAVYAILKNSTTASVFFSDKSMPFYGKTLKPGGSVDGEDQIELDGASVAKYPNLATNGFFNVTVQIIRKPGWPIEKRKITLPVFEEGATVEITNEMLGIDPDGDKFYPVKITAYNKDLKIYGVFMDKKGLKKQTVIVSENQTKIVYLPYGEYALNCGYLDKGIYKTSIANIFVDTRGRVTLGVSNGKVSIFQ
jgi:hypothetical protein